jgi:hypothetical protein
MPQRRQTRRTVLTTIGGGLGLGVASVAPASAQPDELSQQFNGVRAVTRKYRDLETARDDGYADISGYVPSMGFHFANEVPPFGTDLDDPGVLVYFTNGSYNPAPGDSHDPDTTMISFSAQPSGSWPATRRIIRQISSLTRIAPET